MRRNAGLEMTRAVDGSVSVTVAVVGRSVTKEISPKNSPASSVLTFLPLRRTSALPSSRTKNCRPGSSSRIKTLPSARSISSAIFATSVSARFESPPKSGTRLRSSVFSGALRLRIAPILRREQDARLLRVQPVGGLARSRDAVHVRCAVGREARDPQDVDGSAAAVQLERRRAVHRLRRGIGLRRACGVAGLDDGAEARRVGRHGQLLQLDRTRRIQDEADAVLGDPAEVLVAVML